MLNGIALEPAARPRWVLARQAISSLVVLAVAYLPFCVWVFFESRPWDDYRWLWVKILPLMPTLLPADLLGRLIGAREDTQRLLLAAVLLAVVLPAVLCLAMRSWRWCVGVSVVVGLLAIGLSIAVRAAMLA